MEDKSSSAASDHQHKVTHNRFRTDPPATPWKMEFEEMCGTKAKKKKETAGASGRSEAGARGTGRHWCDRPERPAWNWNQQPPVRWGRIGHTCEVGEV